MTPHPQQPLAAPPDKVETNDLQSTGSTLVDFFESFADRLEEFVIYDDGYRRWSYTYRQVGAAATVANRELRRVRLLMLSRDRLHLQRPSNGGT